MAKWALLAAHRYLETDAGPRRVGPDGRERQPWRRRSPAAVATARSARTARVQPWWPRPLGCLLLGLAMLHVLDPGLALPTQRAGVSSARGGAQPKLVGAMLPAGPHEGVPAEFRWQPAAGSPPYDVIVLDADYRELRTVSGLAEPAMATPADLAAALAAAGTFHWQVVGTTPRGPRRGPLETVEVR